MGPARRSLLRRGGRATAREFAGFFFATAFFLFGTFLAVAFLAVFFFTTRFLLTAFFLASFFLETFFLATDFFVTFLLVTFFFLDAGFFRATFFLLTAFFLATTFFFDDFFAVDFFLLILRLLPAVFFRLTGRPGVAFFLLTRALLRFLLAVFLAVISNSCRIEKRGIIHLLNQHGRVFTRVFGLFSIPEGAPAGGRS
jgi:hypothetical protein